MPPKSANTIALDLIQNQVHQYLKPLGFKKKGRTYNREAEKGIFQVINFQAGEFPLGDNYVIPGLRENYYGKFTVNLGVLVRELYDLSFPNKPRDFFPEYYCDMRTRLPNLTVGKDYWWEISGSSEEISAEIIKGLNFKGVPWLDTFETRDKICRNWGSTVGFSNRAKLDIALIEFFRDKKKGVSLFQDYYHNATNVSNHLEYVKNLALKLEIPLT